MIFAQITKIQTMIFRSTSKIPITLCALFSILTLTLISCETASTPVENRIAPKISQRNEVVRRYIRADLKIGQQYIDFGFGNERIVKPQSFRRLDSLYAEYLTEDNKKAGASKNKLLNLKSEIESEKSKVLADTVHFLYEQPHFFGVVQGDSLLITFADFTLNSSNKIIRVDMQYSFKTPSRNGQFYRAYLNRESFVDLGYAPSVEETKFYTFFDGMLNTLGDFDAKGVFLEHTLQIMRSANQQGGLRTEPLIKQHVINTITRNVKGYKSITWSRVYTNMDENDVLVSYEVDHEWSYTDINNVKHELKRIFTLNPFFEITEVREISLIRS